MDIPDISPEEWEIARQKLTVLIENINNPQGTCFQCGKHVEHKEQIGRSVYRRPCGCRYTGKLSKRTKGK